MIQSNDVLDELFNDSSESKEESKSLGAIREQRDDLSVSYELESAKNEDSEVFSVPHKFRRKALNESNAMHQSSKHSKS